MAGIFLLLIGILRLGSYIKYIPYPVTVGFIAGIAVILLVGQAGDFLGLTMAENPPDILPKLRAIGAALPTVNGRRCRRRRYGRDHRGSAPLRAELAGHPHCRRSAQPRSGAPEAAGRDDRHSLRQHPQHPACPVAASDLTRKAQAVLPDAVAFALLGAIESLLSAMVADGMTGRRHRSNMELVAQGVANIASALFGGSADRHRRPYGDQRTRRRGGPGLGYPPRGLCPAVHAGRRTTRELTSRWRGSPVSWSSSRGTWPKNTPLPR